MADRRSNKNSSPKSINDDTDEPAGEDSLEYEANDGSNQPFHQDTHETLIQRVDRSAGKENDDQQRWVMIALSLL